MQLDYINSQRRDMKLIINEPLENAPPSLAFATVAMGAFRGLVVDILWIRADRLKEKGQFFDARQLAEWITTLQPRFGDVWVFHAWNMAYNISVTIPETKPDQRWQWVKNGYELLRDKGLQYNPRNIHLYHELARIFQHKIGSVSDNAHKYYKLELARAMSPLLGDGDDKFFDALVDASHWLWGDSETPDFKQAWEKIAADPNFSSFIEQLRAADEQIPDDERFVSSYLSLRQDARRFDPAASKVIDEFRGKPELKRLSLLAQAFQLRKIWKLDAVLMRELNKKHGPIDWADPNTHLPLDWRHADTHAIYWAVLGLRKASAEKGEEISGHETNTDRIVAHSLQNLFRNGKIFVHSTPVPVPSSDPSEPPKTRMYTEVYLRPDLRMFSPYNKAIMDIIAKYKAADDKAAYRSLGNGHRNMLRNALLSFYQSGHKEYAQKIYDQLRELYPSPDFEVPLVEYARKRMIEEFDQIGIADAKEQVIAILKESYYLYAIHDDDAAFGREELASQLHRYYQAVYSDEQRIDLPDLKLLKYLSLTDFLSDGQFSPYLKGSLLARIEVERPDLFEQLQRIEQENRKSREETEQP
ncbi:MAG: hypothetical protein JW720_12435 [Sedimentisphaerales bacterium]|nr:hypothetical protein [Sedimentisphaerales bacterium]